MANNQTAEVLNEDVATNNAEELTNAVADDAGEVDPQATQNPTDDERRRKGGWLRKLTKAEQERDFWREEALRNRNGQEKTANEQPQAEEKPPVKPSKPKMADFPVSKYETADKAYAAYEDAVDKYEESRDKYTDEKIAWELKQHESKTQQRTADQRVADDWATRVAEAKEKYPDYAEVAFNKELPLTPVMANAILKHKLGTDIAYELGKNPDEAERIAKLDAMEQVMEIGAIASRIAAKAPAVDKDEEEETNNLPAAASRAPRPPTPVRRGAAANTEPSDSDDFKTWVKKREKQIASK